MFIVGAGLFLVVGGSGGSDCDACFNIGLVIGLLGAGTTTLGMILEAQHRRSRTILVNQPTLFLRV